MIGLFVGDEGGEIEVGCLPPAPVLWCLGLESAAKDDLRQLRWRAGELRSGGGCPAIEAPAKLVELRDHADLAF